MFTPSLSFLLCLAAPALSYLLARRGAGPWQAGLAAIGLALGAALAAQQGGPLSTSTLTLSSGQMISISPTARLVVLASALPLLAMLLAARAGAGATLISLSSLMLPALSLGLPLLPYVAGVLPLRFAAWPIKISGALGALGAALALAALGALLYKAVVKRPKAH